MKPTKVSIDTQLRFSVDGTDGFTARLEVDGFLGDHGLFYDPTQVTLGHTKDLFMKLYGVFPKEMDAIIQKYASDNSDELIAGAKGAAGDAKRESHA